MKVFYEKANDAILRQCQDFILNNKNVTANYNRIYNKLPYKSIISPFCLI